MSDDAIRNKIQSMKNDKDGKRLSSWIEPILNLKLSLKQSREEILNKGTSVEEIGGKSADLEELSTFINDLNDEIYKYDSEENLVKSVSIPKFTALTNSGIKAWLNEIQFGISNDKPETYLDKLNSLWQEFIAIQEKQGAKELTEESKIKLIEIQTLLTNVFAENEFPVDKSFDDSVMVRSSTDNEDNKEHSQAGFYDSFPSENDKKSISSTIGKVIASYFNPKIFATRLEQGEDVKKIPGLSCLVQELIKEDVNSIPVSGVVYAKNDGTKIFYVKGHGEGAVGNYQKIKASTAFVTEKGNVYCEFNEQNSRFVPVLKTKNGANKLELIQKENDFTQSTENHLPEEVLFEIAKISQKIRRERKMDMDIEFAVKRNANSEKYSIYLLQNRALTHEKNKQNPSTIDLGYFAANQNKEEIKGKLVTSSILTARVIESSEEIIICNTTAEADTKYVEAVKNNKIIKAVIIKQPAVEGDHFANNFIARNVPIINVVGEKFDEIQAWSNSINVDDESKNINILVVDPQFQRIIKTNDKNIPIVEGLFKSPFSTKVTAKEVKEKDQKHWDIDLEALQEILSVGVDDQRNQADFKRVRSDLENISFPQQGNEEQTQAFARTLRTAYKLRSKNKISQALYQKIAVTIAELWTIRKEIENSNQQKENKDLEILKYLNVYQKLNGLFLNQESLASSVINELKDAKRHEDVTKQINQENNIQRQEYEIPQEIKDENQKEYYKELVTMTKLIAKDDRRKDWMRFCQDICVAGKGKELASLVDYLIKYNLHQYWINTEFLAEANNNKHEADASSLKLLEKLQQQFLPKNIIETKSLVTLGKFLDKLENKINDFSDPEKFDKLFKEFRNSILSFPKTHTNLNLKLSTDLELRMIDIYDKAIKALQLSNEYDENKGGNQKKIENFGLMIECFLDIFERRVEKNDRGGKDSEKLEILKDLTKEKLQNIRDQKNNGIEQLAVSSTFSLSSFLSNSILEFGRGVESVQTIADIHTALHQKMIELVSDSQKTLLLSAIENLPEEVKDFHKKIMTICSYSNFGTFNDITCNKTNTVSIEFINESIKFSYNIALREHSAIFDCEYNLKKKSFSTKMKIIILTTLVKELVK